jgi:hypothetical protein
MHLKKTREAPFYQFQVALRKADSVLTTADARREPANSSLLSKREKYEDLAQKAKVRGQVGPPNSTLRRPKKSSHLKKGIPASTVVQAKTAAREYSAALDIYSRTKFACDVAGHTATEWANTERARLSTGR